MTMLSVTMVQAQEVIELDNDTLHIKLDLTRGGAINYISKSGTTRNIVNIHDEGRYIQQSYYAGYALDRTSEGQSTSWSPWTWNPIQVGDYAGNRAEILDYSIDGNTLYVKCIPMQWDMNNMPAEAEMEQWTSVTGNVLKVRNRLTCHRTDDIYGEGMERDQELPAVYPISALKRLYSYTEDEPFTGALVENLEVINLTSGFWGRYRGMIMENWMAFVDDDLWGIGVYNANTEYFLAGMAGMLGGEATSSATSYIAPIGREALSKNSILEYEYYLVIGSLGEIRQQVYDLAEKGALLPVMPDSVSGPKYYCGVDRYAEYSVPEIEGADSVEWRLLSDNSTLYMDTITIGRSIGITFPDGFESGYLSVRGKNENGYGVASWLRIRIVISSLPVPVVTVRGHLLMSSSQEGNQWYNEYGLIEGETDWLYTVIEDGTYYTIVSLYGCTSDSSNQVEMIISEVEQLKQEKLLSIYPDPCTNILHVEYMGTSGDGFIEIWSMTGKQIYQSGFTGRKDVFVDHLQPGMYLIRGLSGQTVFSEKFIKK